MVNALLKMSCPGPDLILQEWSTRAEYRDSGTCSIYFGHGSLAYLY